jgi:hypothetical protein
VARKTVEELERVFDRAVEILRGFPVTPAIASELLKLLAGASGSEWGTYWQVDSAALLLRPISTWSPESLPRPLLERDTRSRTLSLSEGNAGHVWRSQKPIWTTDLIKDMCLPRSLDAAASGLHGGIWFALKSDQVVYGVVELLGTRLPQPDMDALLALERLGIRLGNWIEMHSSKE